MSARAVLTLLVLVLSLAAAGCASSTGAPSVGVVDPAAEGSADPDAPAIDPDPSVANPAAGACLEGTVDCVDTPGLGMCAPDVDPAECQDVVIDADADRCDPAVASCVEPAPWAPQEPADVGDATTNPIAITEAVTIDDAAVEVRWWSGVEPCHTFAGVEVTEDEDTVTVTVTEADTASTAEEPAACIEIAQAKAAAVTLANPLAGRTLIDGATGQPIAIA